jgi:hypothetical protein
MANARMSVEYQKARIEPGDSNDVVWQSLIGFIAKYFREALFQSLKGIDRVSILAK